MDEDAPNITVALIINVIIFIVIPLVMAYRRGFFFNVNEHFNWLKNLFRQGNPYLPTEWTLIGIRQLSAFEKHQIQRVVVKMMQHFSTGYSAIIVLKSGKFLEYPLGENKGYWIDDVIPPNNILIRKWQQGTQYKYDIIPIIAHEQFS
ncbi:hypothetical protein [uncultured Muribaculum sp.]|uniref:hypothetical protein n=1 Tax=uncultured Muribaculum sp. TaxID=1918613 RepID=UPI0025B00A9E|nr:hypothetical protein [uncultured Muribaculum sp.]